MGFHEGGDLIGYRTYGNTKGEILIENPSSEDASCYCYEHMKMVGKFERVSEPDDKATEVDSDSITDDDKD